MNRVRISSLCLIAAFLVVLAAAIEPDLTPDSRDYFAGAESVLAGEGFQNDNNPMTWWPPLYPAALAALRLASGAPLTELARFINLLGALLTLWSLRAPQTVLLVVVSPAFLFVYKWAWTETLFIGLISLFLWQAGRYWCNPSDSAWRWMVGAAILASLTRYAGMTLIATGFLIMAARRQYRAAVGYAILASAPLAIWLARNYLLTGRLTGSRPPSPYTLAENISLAAIYLVLMGIPMLLLLVVVWRILRSNPLPAAVIPALLFASIYLAFVLASSTTIHHDRIGMRLLSPMLPAVAIAAAPFTHRTIAPTRGEPSQAGPRRSGTAGPQYSPASNRPDSRQKSD